MEPAARPVALLPDAEHVLDVAVRRALDLIVMGQPGAARRCLEVAVRAADMLDGNA